MLGYETVTELTERRPSLVQNVDVVRQSNAPAAGQRAFAEIVLLAEAAPVALGVEHADGLDQLAFQVHAEADRRDQLWPLVQRGRAHQASHLFGGNARRQRVVATELGHAADGG